MTSVIIFSFQHCHAWCMSILGNEVKCTTFKKSYNLTKTVRENKWRKRMQLRKPHHHTRNSKLSHTPFTFSFQLVLLFLNYNHTLSTCKRILERMQNVKLFKARVVQSMCPHGVAQKTMFRLLEKTTEGEIRQLCLFTIEPELNSLWDLKVFSIESFFRFPPIDFRHMVARWHTPQLSKFPW